MRRKSTERPQMAKPNGGFTYLVENPLRECGVKQLQIYRQKLKTLKQTVAGFGRIKSPADLARFFTTVIPQLFSSKSAALLKKEGVEYSSLASRGEALDLIALKSMIGASVDADYMYRRTAYVPDVAGAETVYLASKFDRVGSNSFEEGKHEVEYGDLSKTGLKIDISALRRAQFEAVAVAPVMEFEHFPPLGAIVITGEKNFLHPLTDLIVLRELANFIAKAMKKVS